jgi:hypothetical protein
LSCQPECGREYAHVRSSWRFSYSGESLRCWLALVLIVWSWFSWPFTYAGQQPTWTAIISRNASKDGIALLLQYHSLLGLVRVQDLTHREFTGLGPSMCMCSTTLARIANILFRPTPRKRGPNYALNMHLAIHRVCFRFIPRRPSERNAQCDQFGLVLLFRSLCAKNKNKCRESEHFPTICY